MALTPEQIGRISRPYGESSIQGFDHILAFAQAIEAEVRKQGASHAQAGAVPLTDEQIKALMRARHTAMLMTCKARVPECGEFSAIAQDLDWLCESLGTKGGQPAQAAEPVAWKHDCAALLTNDVELWIDACPHCGKPRNAPQPVAREPLAGEQIDRAITELDLDYLADAHATNRAVLRKLCQHANGIKGGPHG